MSIFEALVLDSLALNDGTTFTLEALSMPPPPKKPRWISGADSDGALLASDPHHENRVIEARIRVEPQSTMDLALSKIASLVDKLEECERNARGLALTWVPADATLSAVTFRCLSGEITDLPIDIENGWFVKAPLITVRMTCLPFWEKAETSVGSTTSSAPIITLELTGIGGDVEALGRLVVTDAGSQSRRYVAWGMESRWYPTSSPPSLIVDSSSMVTSGFAGTTATRTAAYSGASNNVISATLRTQPQAICGLGNLTHVGEFRPQLRIYVDATTVALRLTFKALDGPYRSLSYKVPVAIGFNHIDLGLIRIPQALLGTQRWTGQIDAYSTATGGEVFQVDAMWMMPAEQFGRARGTYAYAPGALAGRDEFTGTTAGGSLNARVAPTGGTWATSGATTDYAFADDLGGEQVKRTTVSDSTFRFAVLGTTNYTNVEAGVSVYSTRNDVGASAAAIARWTDSSNYLRGSIDNWGQLRLAMLVGGVTWILTEVPIAVNAFAWYQLRLVAFAGGFAVLSLLNESGITLAEVSAWDSVLATGGTLATGKPGFADSNAAIANTRYYDNFYVATPAGEGIVCYSTQTIEFRHDDVLREDSTGTYYGPPPEYVGARFTIPPAGGPTRKARVAVIARRNDVENAPDDALTSNATTDSTTVAVWKTERGLVVPR